MCLVGTAEFKFNFNFRYHAALTRNLELASNIDMYFELLFCSRWNYFISINQLFMFFVLFFFSCSWNKRVCKINPDNKIIYIDIYNHECQANKCHTTTRNCVVNMDQIYCLDCMVRKSCNFVQHHTKRGMFILIKINGTWNKCITINVYIFLN